jgi:hypothetical protein
MRDSLDKSKGDERQSVANDQTVSTQTETTTSDFEDNSPEAIQMRAFQSKVDGSEEMQELGNYQDKISENTGKEPPIKKPNKTGIPDDLKTSIENLSGYSLDAVKVHYNSDKPAELEAHAYAEGTDIYIAPGQEEHLAHEVWHVVQQMGGKVKETVQLKGVGVNDDSSLEKEADAMGQKAIQLKSKGDNSTEDLAEGNVTGGTLQRLKWKEIDNNLRTQIDLTASQLPAGLQDSGIVEDRRVFAGVKNKSGLLWFMEKTRELYYNIATMTQYEIMDGNTVFYTAVATSAIDAIRENGLDPNYGNADYPKDAAEYNTKGFNYFGKDERTPRSYGKLYYGKTPFQIISFTLPVGTLIERDPEISTGLRTMHHIQPSAINF